MEKKTKFSKVIKWIALNGFVSASLYHGITYHNGLAQLGQYIMWFNAALVFLLMLLYIGDSEEAKKRREDLLKTNPFEQTMPNWINLTYDLVMAAYLAYNSYVWTALIGLMGYAGARILFHQFEEDKQPK